MSSLEYDMELLTAGEPGSPLPQIPFELRMAVVYRAEKKHIINSQLNLVRKVLNVLDSVEDVLLNVSEDQKHETNKLFQ